MSKQPYKFLIGGILSLVIAMGIGRFAYTPILPSMQNDVGFSDSIAGYLATVNYAGYLIGAILAGIISWKKHKTMALRFSLIVSIITTALMGAFQTYILWYVFRFLSGIASAFIFVLASSIVLDELATKNKTSWSGIFYSGVGIGIFLTSLVIPRTNNVFNWEGSWIGLALVSILLSIFVWIWLIETDEAPARNNGNNKIKNSGTIANLPPMRWLPLLIIAYGLEGLGYIVTGTFIVSIAEKSSVFSGNATLVWLVVGLGAIPSCIIWSLLAKRCGFVKSLVIAMTLQAIGIVAPVIWMSQFSLILSALLFGATFMGITTLATTLARQMNPSDSSRVIGYLTTTYAIGQMIGPAIAGVLSSVTRSYDVALIGAATVVLVGGMLLLSGVKFEKSVDSNRMSWKI